MGYKNVCLNCLRVESIGTDYEKFKTDKCAECNNEMFFVNHKFRPPKKTDKKSWEVIKLLLKNGFVFQRVYDKNGIRVDYPSSINEAKLFVEKYKLK